MGQCSKNLGFSLIWKTDLAGKQHRICPFIPGTVLVITNQREAPAGKLHPDLVTAPGVKPDADKTVSVHNSKADKFQSCFFYALSLPFYCENLVLFGILPKKVCPVTVFGHVAMNHGNVFFYHSSFLYRFGQGGSSLLISCVDHNAAYVFVQPVDRIDLTAQLFF